MSHTLVEEKVMRQLLDCLQECSDELAAELSARHRHRDTYDVVRQAYQRDMAPVIAARILLEEMRDEC
jgi:hypothetical protein